MHCTYCVSRVPTSLCRLIHSRDQMSERSEQLRAALAARLERVRGTMSDEEFSHLIDDVIRTTQRFEAACRHSKKPRRVRVRSASYSASSFRLRSIAIRSALKLARSHCLNVRASRPR
jgi:hypothetical protein